MKKRQALYIILSILVPLGIGTVTNGILPIFNIFVLPTGALLVSTLSILIVFAIIKYGLFEITPRSILSSINHAIITVDDKLNILHMNMYAEKLLRVRSSQVSGTSVDKILHVGNTQTEVNNHLTHLLERVLKTGRTITSDTYTIMNKKILLLFRLLRFIHTVR